MTQTTPDRSSQSRTVTHMLNFISILRTIPPPHALACMQEPWKLQFPDSLAAGARLDFAVEINHVNSGRQREALHFSLEAVTWGLVDGRCEDFMAEVTFHLHLEGLDIVCGEEAKLIAAERKVATTSGRCEGAWRPRQRAGWLKVCSVGCWDAGGDDIRGRPWQASSVTCYEACTLHLCSVHRRES